MHILVFTNKTYESIWNSITKIKMESNLELIPRLYQAQIEEIAFRKNTIIHLPTGIIF